MNLNLLLFSTLALALPAAAADVYVSDPAHTQAFYELGHLNISWLRGRFSAVDVKVVLDRPAKQGSIDAVIKTASVDSAHEARDKLIRSEDYLNVEKFPTMTFKSTQLKFNGDTLVGADGELTLAGVTKPVSLDIPFFKCIQHPTRKTEVCGAEARTTIKRSEFGVKRGATTPMHDEVKIAIQVEAYKQPQ